MSNREKTYTLYRGDQFIDVGTLREISERQHMSRNTLKFMATPVYRRKEVNYEKRLCCYKVEN